ncbi:DUF6069 family protein [Actinomadura sp. HBU206391]|uniref:DUF6069 family protein n=1 Tax=Actinomadura sp. HBU206391 TaxID=2731692 RepID=UPI00164F203D|nr:DUF6069 family protein [Actinomadura sp. HBU206391]MBC6459006.1 hypothetical protein [Actinomadura sp. HBU206391]
MTATAMTTAPTTAPTTAMIDQTTRPVVSSARRARSLAVGAAVLANSLIYLVAHALGTDFKLTDPGKAEAHALILPEIIVFTLVPCLLGWGALALLERYTRHAKAIWTVLATVVLALSFVPLAIEHATTDTKIVLSVIHLVVAAVLVPVLRRSSAQTR